MVDDDDLDGAEARRGVGEEARDGGLAGDVGLDGGEGVGVRGEKGCEGGIVGVVVRGDLRTLGWGGRQVRLGKVRVREG